MKRLLLLTIISLFAVSAGVPIPFACTDGTIFPQHEPYGTGIGAVPGRVVWAHEPQSVSWDGNGFWWEPEHFDESVILTMVNNSVARLANQPEAKSGWNTLFSAHNQSREKIGGYKAGEKIAIKANINGSAVFDDDTSGETHMSYTNPVLLKALLISLVEEAGVAPSDITVYDVSRLFPDYMVEMCSTGRLQGVNFVDRSNGTADESAPINWSHSFSGAINYLPTCVTGAEYLINLANLKGHSYGITLCGKNHFGSFINGNAMRPPEGASLHQWLTKNEMEIYSPLVDLMANEKLGGKTVLYMLDALICAPSEGASITGSNAKWQQTPFDGNYTSSIFVSQDPVAIDSVGADFLVNEPAVTNHNSAVGVHTVENYLHEAGLVAEAPSGTAYTDGNGGRVTNLGVHEHWNNQTEKIYSRNLGKNDGIELVMAEQTDGPKIFRTNDVITVEEAPENSTLITVFYQNGILAGVRLYRGSKTITADISRNVDGADTVKAFLWDKSRLMPVTIPPEETAPSISPNANEIILTISGQDFTATLFDNEAAEAFRTMLPMTVTMNELNGNEKYHYLSGSLPVAEENPDRIQTGDLMLYGTNSLVLFYETFSSSYRYTQLGKVTNTAGLKDALGSGNISVTFRLP